MSVVVNVIVLAREILLYIGWRWKRGRLVFNYVYDRGRLAIINITVSVRHTKMNILSCFERVEVEEGRRNFVLNGNAREEYR